MLVGRAGGRLDTGRQVEREHRYAGIVHRIGEQRRGAVERQPRVRTEDAVEDQRRRGERGGCGRQRAFFDAGDACARAGVVSRFASGHVRVAVHDTRPAAGVGSERGIRVAAVVSVAGDRDHRAIAARVPIDEARDRVARCAHQRDLAVTAHGGRIDGAHLRRGDGSHRTQLSKITTAAAVVAVWVIVRCTARTARSASSRSYPR
jgi:hypothetical protein